MDAHPNGAARDNFFLPLRIKTRRESQGHTGITNDEEL